MNSESEHEGTAGWLANYTGTLVTEAWGTRWLAVKGEPCTIGAAWRHVKVFDLYVKGTRGSKRVYHLTHNGERFARSAEFKVLAEHYPDATPQIEAALRQAQEVTQ
jgi:hypothetical protein